MTTQEKINYAEKRIAELQLLINHWKTSHLRSNEFKLKLLKLENKEQLSKSIAA